VGSFLSRHQPKFVAAAIVLAIGGMIWVDDHRTVGLPKGQPAPSFEMNVLGSPQKVTLAGMAGEPVVLDFWATWCAPCRASLPHLDELSKRYEGRVHFVAVNAQSEDVAAQSETRDMLKLKMPIATDGYDAASLYHVEKLPTTVILDSRGHVARTFEGPAAPETIAKALDALL